MATEITLIQNDGTRICATLPEALQLASAAAEIRIMQSGGDVLGGFTDVYEREYQPGGSLAWDIQGGTVCGNAAGNGGLVYADRAGSLNGVMFVLNAATAGSGGALFQNKETLRVSGATFVDNSAFYSGGAIYSVEGIPLLAGSGFERNRAMYGGGVSVNSASASNTMIRGCFFNGNLASNSGGGVYIGRSLRRITVENSQFIANSAGNGGAVFLENTALGGVDVIGCFFAGNTASCDGGAFYTNVAAVVIDSLFMMNASTSNGGAMMLHGGTAVTVSGSFFQGNVSAAAGVVYIGPSVGGIAFLDSGFDGNVSRSEGGAIYNTSGSMRIGESTFSGNTAAGQGGGVYSITGAVHIENSRFSGNCARDGAAVGLASGQLSLRGVTFSGSTATSRGGAMCVSGQLTVTDSVFSGNTGAYGSAICLSTVYNTDVNELTGATFRGNVGGGGVIYIETPQGSLTFRACVFADNRGVAINNLGGCAMTVSDTLFSGNTAAYGGALVNYGRVSVSGSTFSGLGDVIVSSGTIGFSGRNLIGADITSYGTFLVRDAELVFINSGRIALSPFTVGGTVGLTFSGRYTVDFGGLDLTLFQPCVTVTTAGLPAADSLVVASGLHLDEDLRITVEDRSVGLNDSFTVGGIDYTTSYRNGELTLSRTSGYDMVFVAPDGTASVVVDGNTVALSGQPVFSDCASGKAALNSGGTLVVAGRTSAAFELDDIVTILTGCAICPDGLEFTDLRAVDVSFQYGTPPVAVHGRSVAGNCRITYEDFVSGDERILADIGVIGGDLRLALSGGSTGSGIALLGGGSCRIDGDLDLAVRNADFGGAVRLTASGTDLAEIAGEVAVSVADSVFRGGLHFGATESATNIGGGFFLRLADSAVIGGGVTVSAAVGNAVLELAGSTVSCIGGNTGPLTVTVAAHERSSVIGGFDAGTVDRLVILSAAGLVFETPRDLSDIALTVDGSICQAGAVVIASGVTAVGDFTIIGGTEQYGLMLLDRELYLVKSLSKVGDATDNYVTGGTVNLVTGGVIGGCFIGTGPRNTGDVRSVITGGTFMKPVIGGGLVRQNEQPLAMGKVTLEISGGSFLGDKLYAAGYAYGMEDRDRGTSPELSVASSCLFLSDVVIGGDIYGGAHTRRNGTAVVSVAEIAVTSGEYGSIYGGGWAEKDSVSIVVDAVIDISGGRVGSIYAGGGSSANGTTRITGGVAVSVGGDAGADFVFLAGKNRQCWVEGDAVLTVSGEMKEMIRISGRNGNGSGDRMLGTSVLNLETDLTVDYLDYVDEVNIKEGSLLTVRTRFLAETISGMAVNFVLDGDLDGDWDVIAGGEVPANTKALIAEVNGVGIDVPFSREKLSPTLALYKVDTYEQAIDNAKALLEYGGLGHTAVLYTNTQNEERIREFGHMMLASRVIINSPASHGAIGDLYNFALNPSLTLGCGSWGGNYVSENVGPMNLLNIKSIAKRRENMLWFQIPSKIYFKYGCLCTAIKDLAGKKRAFIVTDKFLYSTGLLAPMLQTLTDMGIATHVFSDVTPDPTIQLAHKGLEQLKSFDADVIPSLNADPFNPTICSVERFVNNKDPAITGYVKLLPARKKPSCDAVSRFRTMSQVPNATKTVKKRNEIIVIANMIGSFRCNKYTNPL